MAKGGDVLVLDMGKPVRIQDLARRMIRLMGLTVRDEQNPDGDIEIVYTGLRPAEKLFEELLIGGTVTGTEHPMIMRAVEHSLPWPAVQFLLSELLEALNRFDCAAARDLLKQAVIEYSPSRTSRTTCGSASSPRTALQDVGKVTDLAARRARTTSA
jgi:FlaA1/EpsC-like NDP-sugar epimerase